MHVYCFALVEFVYFACISYLCMYIDLLNVSLACSLHHILLHLAKVSASTTLLGELNLVATWFHVYGARGGSGS